MIFQTYDAKVSVAELAHVRRYDGNAIPPDYTQFYVRFLATSAANTLQSLKRVGITVCESQRERTYNESGAKKVWRPLYLFFGPSLVIMLMEAVAILACKLNSSFFVSWLSMILFSEAASHAQHDLFVLAAPRRVARACDQDARPGCASAARDI